VIISAGGSLVDITLAIFHLPSATFIVCHASAP
jgi:hypothetical protein